MTIEITFGSTTIRVAGDLPYRTCASVLRFLGEDSRAIYRRQDGAAVAWVDVLGLVAVEA
ncbi:MAG TPA: hypothetical protein VGQ83_16670 [Polyangia bacterium]|jgi:hypothetical protein